MNAILTQLSEWNDFDFVRLQANFSQFDLNEKFSRDLEAIRNKVSSTYLVGFTECNIFLTPVLESRQTTVHIQAPLLFQCRQVLP